MISRVNGFICLTEQARQRAAAGYDPVRPEAGKVAEVTVSPGLETSHTRSALPAKPSNPVVRALV